MDLDPETIRERAAAYGETEAFALVESERLETLPESIAEGSAVWKDAEWIVRWYCRRSLGEFPTDRREVIEGRFRDNDWSDVDDAIAAARDSLDADDGIETAIRTLTTLEGVSVPVATAFLQYIDPDDHLTMDPVTWTVLAEAGRLDDYPADPAPGEYLRYRTVCRRLAEEADVTLVEVYRALWRSRTELASEVEHEG